MDSSGSFLSSLLDFVFASLRSAKSRRTTERAMVIERFRLDASMDATKHPALLEFIDDAEFDRIRPWLVLDVLTEGHRMASRFNAAEPNPALVLSYAREHLEKTRRNPSDGLRELWENRK